MKESFLLPISTLLTCFFLTFTGHAQEQVDDLLIYESPTKDFYDIVLQQHNGLPRFGLMNAYGLFSNGGANKGSKTPELSRTERLEKSRKVGHGFQSYSNMIKLKFLLEAIDQLDKEKPLPAKTNYSEEEKTMLSTIRTLQEISIGLCLSEECKNSFRGKNEFERARNYKNYMNKILPSLLSWNKTVLENDVVTGYYVYQLNIGNGRGYDFEKEGYWVSYNSKVNLFSRSLQTVYSPKTSFEKELAIKAMGKRLQFLIPFSPEKAEELQNQTHNLYMVQKIQLSYTMQETPRKAVLASYNFENPSLEIYTDSGLKEKLMTISLDKVEFKTP